MVKFTAGCFPRCFVEETRSPPQSVIPAPSSHSQEHVQDQAIDMTAHSLHTPKKRRTDAAQPHADDSAADSPATILSGWRSWLSPWRGNSKSSAAFGSAADEETDRPENDSLQNARPPSQSVLRDKSLPSAASEEASIYPSLPSLQHDLPMRTTEEAPSLVSPMQKSQRADAAAATSYDPISHNYSLLARFFAEKAAESRSRTSADLDIALTEEELEGCRVLIEDSGKSIGDVQRDFGYDSVASTSFGASGKGSQDRRSAIEGRRNWLNPQRKSTALSAGSSVSGMGGKDGISLLSSPEQRLPNAATPVVCLSSTGSPLFAPQIRSPSNPFLSGRTDAMTAKQAIAAKPRHRRPLYVGPGMSERASISSMRRPGLATSGDSAAAANNTRAMPSANTAISLGEGLGVSLGKRPRVSANEDEQDATTRHTNTTSSDGLSLGPQDAISASDECLNPRRKIASSSRVLKTQAGSVDSPPTLNRPPKDTTSSAQSRTASAVLSILADSSPQESHSTGPSQHSGERKKRAINDRQVGDVDRAETPALRSDSILNPYQSSPEIQLGTRFSTSPRQKSRTAEAVERLKDERRLRSSRSRPSTTTTEDLDTDRAAAHASMDLLQEIERTRPTASRTPQKTAPQVTPVVPPLSLKSGGNWIAPPSLLASSSRSSRSSSEGDSSGDRTAESSKRLTSQQTPPVNHADSDSSSSRSNKTSSAVSSGRPPVTSAGLTQSKAHAPPRPSRLSIAFNAGEDSSSIARTEDDTGDGIPLSTGSIAPTSSSDKRAPSKAGVHTASLQRPSASTFAPTDSSVSAVPKDSAPSVGIPTRVSNHQATSDNIEELPSPPLAIAAAPREPIHSASDLSVANILAKPISSLPEFDLAATALLPTWFARTSTSQEEQQRRKAAATDTDRLPRFDLGVTNSVSMSLPTTLPDPRSVTQVTGTNLGSAPLKSPPGPGPNNSQSGEDGMPQQGQSRPLEETDVSNPTPSALLGSGEGEESETTLFEARAKFWRFVEGQWTDLGVGIARVKRASTLEGDSASRSSPARLLVRNAGNGAVMVNFSLFTDFKATQNGQTLSFTGFNAEGKSCPMRCKVKTVDSATEFKSALEGANS
ncbi:unnamed protein product [Jaminaea pallidilutea]